jgi:hypothetical protein
MEAVLDNVMLCIFRTRLKWLILTGSNNAIARLLEQRPCIRPQAKIKRNPAVIKIISLRPWQACVVVCGFIPMNSGLSALMIKHCHCVCECVWFGSSDFSPFQSGAKNIPENKKRI